MTSVRITVRDEVLGDTEVTRCQNFYTLNHERQKKSLENMLSWAVSDMRKVYELEEK